MAARRPKRQAKRTTKTGTPAWVWLVAVAAIGAVVLMAAPNLFKSDGDGFLRVGPRPDPDAVPAPVADADIDVPASAPRRAERSEPDRPTSPQYDFYTLLPGSEVQMSDAELAALTKAENDRKSRQQQEADRAAAALAGQSPVPALPAPLDETPVAPSRPATPAAPPAPAAPATTDAQRALAALEGRQIPSPVAEKPASASRSTTPAPVNTATAAAAPARSTPVTTPAAEAPASNVRYLLQAGAFGNSGEAEAIKARLAMSGLAARVEPTQVNGGTVYRVRVGPYQSANDLSEAKSKLESSGLQAMAVKVQ